MNRKWHNLRLLSFLFLLITLSLAAARSASAAGTRWARWHIDTAFSDGKITSELNVQIWYTTSTGKKILQAEEDFPITCTSVGNPVIQNDVAIFDGNSYYQCDMPSIQEKVYQMPGHLQIPASCDSKQPFVAGTLMIEDNPVQWNPSNPIFHRDDIQFSLPYNTSLQEAQMLVAFSRVAAESGYFTPSQTANSLLAIYNKNRQSYTPEFTVDSMGLTASPASINGPLPLTTLASTIYIGYSPLTGKYFEGSLTSLLVDPVCIGQG